MATEDDARSDVSNNEKPVREKLKNASIGPKSKESTNKTTRNEGVADDNSSEQNGKTSGAASPDVESSTGLLKKKRSHDDMNESPLTSEQTSAHVRKRSRDGTPEVPRLKRRGTPELKADSAIAKAAESIASPKFKKTRHTSEELETNGAATISSADTTSTAIKSPDHEDASNQAESGQLTDSVSSTADINKSESGIKRQPDDSSGSIKLPSSSGFANASRSSPFGAIAGTKTSETSATTFASSAFGAAAGAKTSGFGVIGKSSSGFQPGSGFAAASQAPVGGTAHEDQDKSASVFGGALGQKSAFATGSAGGNAFGGSASGFGKLGTATGSAFGGNGPAASGFGSLGRAGAMTSFASGKPAAPIPNSAKPAKAFGASADEDEEDADGEDEEQEGEGAGIRSPNLAGEEKQDERFYEQDIETGEEDEITKYTCRAKLYNFGPNEDGKKAWKERGHGTIRLNVKKVSPGAEDIAPQARLVMRVDGSHKVALNTPVKKEIRFGAPKGGPPEGPYIFFLGAIINEDGKSGGLELLQLKVKPQYALELYNLVAKLQQAM